MRPGAQVYIPAHAMRTADGTFLVQAGKPVEWLTAKQFGDALGLSAASVLRYIGKASIPEKFIQRTGRRKIRIHAAALQHFQEYWRKQRTGKKKKGASHARC